MTKQETLRLQLESAAEKCDSPEALMSLVVNTLKENLAYYNWVGFYMIEEKPGEEPMLVLGPFVGADTPHKRIPLNRGICGAAASTGETVIVDDVNSDPRYLACSIETKSEIVAPVFVNGKVVGELDIDGHRRASFSNDEDRKLVEACAALVGRFMERQSR